MRPSKHYLFTNTHPADPNPQTAKSIGSCAKGSEIKIFMMPTVCCVYKCKSKFTKENAITFHHFPKSGKLIFKWILILKIGSKLKWSSAKVCQLHFSSKQYDNYDTRRLKYDAVPDSNLPKRPAKIFNISDLPPKRMRKLQVMNDYIYDPVVNIESSTSSVDIEGKLSSNATSASPLAHTEPNNNLEYPVHEDFEVHRVSKTYPIKRLDMLQQATECTGMHSEDSKQGEKLVLSSLFENLGREEEVEYQKLTTTQETDTLRSLSPEIDTNLLCLGGVLAVHGLKPKQFTYLSGLTKVQFDVVYNLCIYRQSGWPWPYYRIPLKEQLLLTLIKYRHNWEYRMLAIIFKIREGTAQEIFIFWTKLLYNRLETIDFWSMRSRNDGEYVVILDCTEIPVEKPAAPDLQQATFSKYKNTNTFKTLVAIDEQGVILFVSNIFGGCVSDNRIVEMSGIVDLLSEGDFVLADRGFEQIDALSAKGVVLNRPPRKKGAQLTEQEVASTRAIASRRIDVERVIGYAKTYKILKQKVKYSLFPMMDMIIKILFKLTNLRRPICKIKNDKAR
nr:uncharacterized protein LOC115270923 [Aedes albopictus]